MIRQKDKIRYILLAVKASTKPVSLRTYGIGGYYESAIKSSGLLEKVGSRVLWKEGSIITDEILESIMKKAHELYTPSSYKTKLKTINKPKEVIKEWVQTSLNVETSKSKQIASLLRQIADILELAEAPCKNHNPKQLSYLSWHDWASKMTAQGKKQTQCNKCGRWYFKSEM